MTTQHPPDCWGAYGSSRLSTWHCVSCRRHHSGLSQNTYRSPSRWHHEILRLLIRECDQAIEWKKRADGQRTCSVSLFLSLLNAPSQEWRLAHQRGFFCYSLQRCFGHGYPSSLQILLQARVELRQAAQLQLRHALLLRLAVPAGPDLIRTRHHAGQTFWASKRASPGGILDVLQARLNLVTSCEMARMRATSVEAGRCRRMEVGGCVRCGQRTVWPSPTEEV